MSLTIRNAKDCHYDLVVRESGDDRGVETETFAKPARDVVFAAAFPCGELPGCPHPPLAGVEAEHDFSEGNEVVVAVFGVADGEAHGVCVG